MLEQCLSFYCQPSHPLSHLHNKDQPLLLRYQKFPQKFVRVNHISSSQSNKHILRALWARISLSLHYIKGYSWESNSLCFQRHNDEHVPSFSVTFCEIITGKNSFSKNGFEIVTDLLIQFITPNIQESCTPLFCFISLRTLSSFFLRLKSETNLSTNRVLLPWFHRWYSKNDHSIKNLTVKTKL